MNSLFPIALLLAPLASFGAQQAAISERSPLVQTRNPAVVLEGFSTLDQTGRLEIYSRPALHSVQYSSFSLQGSRAQNPRRKTGAFDYRPTVVAVLGGGLLGSLGAGLGGGPWAGLGGGAGSLTGAVLAIHILPHSDRLLVGGMFGFPVGVAVGAASSGGSVKDVALGLVGGHIGYLLGLGLGPAIF
jgi:hypothetical protein